MSHANICGDVYQITLEYCLITIQVGDISSCEKVLLATDYIVHGLFLQLTYHINTGEGYSMN